MIGGASDPAGDSGANGLMDMANAVLRELVAAGSSERRRISTHDDPDLQPHAGRIHRPFADGAACGIALLHRQLDTLADPLWAQYRESNDLDAFASVLCRVFRGGL